MAQSAGLKHHKGVSQVNGLGSKLKKKKTIAVVPGEWPGQRPNMSQGCVSGETWMTSLLFQSSHHLRLCWRLTVEEPLGKVLARGPGDAFVLLEHETRSRVPVHDFTVH